MKTNRSAAGDVAAQSADAATAQAAAQAKRDKAGLLSDQLSEDTLLRARRFGVRPFGLSLGQSAMSAGGGSSGVDKGSHGSSFGLPLFANGIVGQFLKGLF